MTQLYVIMGVSGSGKSTLAQALSQEFDALFLEGDDFHPENNIEKMASGVPLTNTDRIAWIDAMGHAVRKAPLKPIFLSCSALNDFVRTRLIKRCQRPVIWIYLDVSEKELLRRLRTRENHFMKADMLSSQLATMEPPLDAITLKGDAPIEDVLTKALKTLFPLHKKTQ